MIEVNITEGTRTWTYPRLMRGITQPGLVVLFFGPSMGCVVSRGAGYFDEPYSNHWDMNEFVDFTGTLELRNQ